MTSKRTARTAILFAPRALKEVIFLQERAELLLPKQGPLTQPRVLPCGTSFSSVAPAGRESRGSRAARKKTNWSESFAREVAETIAKRPGRRLGLPPPLLNLPRPNAARARPNCSNGRLKENAARAPAQNGLFFAQPRAAGPPPYSQASNALRRQPSSPGIACCVLVGGVGRPRSLMVSVLRCPGPPRKNGKLTSLSL